MDDAANLDLDALLRDGSLIDRALIEARTELLRQHRLTGIPLVVWRDGKTHLLVPEGAEDSP